MAPTYTEGVSSLLVPMTHMPNSPKHTFTDTPRANMSPVLWVFHHWVHVAPEINHYTIQSVLGLEDAKQDMLAASELCGRHGHKCKSHSNSGKCQMRQTQELHVRKFRVGEGPVLQEEGTACTEALKYLNIYHIRKVRKACVEGAGETGAMQGPAQVYKTLNRLYPKEECGCHLPM